MRKFYYSFLSIFSGVIRIFFSRNLRVLAYHKVHDRTRFSKQIAYLKSRYNVIDIATLKETIKDKSKKLPKNVLLITFDDGDKNTLDKALPVLMEHKISSCIFIVTEYINTNNSFWWDRIKENEKSNKSYKEIRKKINHLKAVSNKERLESLKNYSGVEKEQLNTEDLYYMQKNRMFVGNHSHSHPMLDRCTETEIQKEMDSSRFLFDKWDLPGFGVFAYPNGSRNQLSEKLLKKNDIQLAFLFDHKLNPARISPLRISRIKTNANMPVSELKVKVSGLHSLFSKYKNRKS